jgi:TonB family protein
MMGGVPGDPTLQRGTQVFASIDGPMVGEVGYYFTLKPTKVVKAWSRFNVRTRFGIVEIWARPGDQTPPPPAPRINVPPTTLEPLRTSGDKNLVPDDATKKEILRSGKGKLVGSFKMCLDTTGKITEVKLLKSTGYAAYDEAIRAGMRAWTYKPYETDGKAAAVCTAVTFIYAVK